MRNNNQSPERQLQNEETQRIPLLHDCIRTLKKLGYDSSDLTLKDRGNLFLSGVAFLCHLKADQEVLNSAWNRALNENSSAICPPPSSTPAISVLLDDPTLFQAIIGILSSKNPTDQDLSTNLSGASSTPGTHMVPKSNMGALKSKQGFQQSHPRGNRKRAGSVEKVPETPNKMSKLHLSPGGPNIIPGVKGALPSTLSLTNDAQKRLTLDINLRVFAASIFYVALQHMDHWPIPLISAYAEDCFGPRLWVDDDRCKLLTDNLSSILTVNEDGEKLDPEFEKAADKMAELFTKPQVKRPLTNETPDASHQEQPNKKHRIENKIGRSQELHSHAKVPNKMQHFSSDSDSGGEECVMEVSVGTSLKPLVNQNLTKVSKPSKDNHQVATINQAKDNAYTSSSGEEYEEEEGTIVNAIDGPLPKRPRTGKKNFSLAGKKSLSLASHPRDWYQHSLNMTQVRNRYFGKNRNLAYKSIADALSQRLDSKTKQNSRLLSILPMFVSIPGVRRLAARHLERWLQSPALAGLGRSLFSSVVGAMHNVDPPLSDDIDAINSILSMKLKANQLTVHIDNVTSIAKTIPTTSISQHIFTHLLREEIVEIEKGISQTESASSDHLRMFVAAYVAFPPPIAAEALAVALVSLATESKESLPQPIERIWSLLCRVAVALGSSYDGHLLVKYLLNSKKLQQPNMSIENVHITAKIAFECIILIIPSPSSAGSSGSYHRQHSKSHWKGVSSSKGADTNGNNLNNGLSEEAVSVINKKLTSIRKIVLKWCVTALPCVFSIDKNDDKKSTPDATSSNGAEVGSRRKGLQTKRAPVGAGAPIFHSVLDGQTHPDGYSFDVATHDMLKVMRCVLFLVDPDSQELSSFLLSSPTNSIDSLICDQQYQIRLCREYGTDVDDEMIWIVLKSAATPDGGINERLAICLIELLFMNCRHGQNSRLRLSDCSIAWQLYNLVEYKPQKYATENGYNCNSAERAGENKSEDEEIYQQDGSAHPIPRLAYPGDWWRVTSIVLVMCGVSPKTIGTQMWENHPTVRALIKMTTSGRYKFPTVDCDEEQKEKMRQSETKSRDQESKLAEMLFLPKSTTKKKEKRPDNNFSPHGGSRVSARQRQKQARILARQREQEAALALAEAQRTRKLLRAAQKSIMLWDPKSTPRKPPKESVNLILAVGDYYQLSDIFRQWTDPDFLLWTIGCTSRSSIDRAHDWLIPVISSHPRTIDRLPPSASCFLLIRAYGNEGDKNNQLLELSAPLLRHVRDCLTGKFGESDAVLAADLLLSDVADPEADRRRCARRVLQEALVDINVNETNHHVDDVGDCDWLFKLLYVEHAKALMSISIKHVSQALAYERGRVLRAFVLALHKYIEFARDNKLQGTWNFVSTLCELLSVRPHICSAAMDRFSDFRDLAVHIVHAEFENVLYRKESGDEIKESTSAIRLVIRKLLSGTQSSREVTISSQLMRAAIVLISTWQTVESSSVQGTGATHDNIVSLVNYLLPASDSEYIGADDDISTFGASAATFVNNGKRAVPVDQWVMLVKAQTDFIARNAALSAPDIFLPRLILCCGLPRSSLVTMLEHLGKLGDSSSDPKRCFYQLLSPSATAEWGISYTGNRRMIARKLIGRLSAYRCIHRKTSKPSELVSLENAYKSSFVKWLFEEGCGDDKHKKGRSKRGNWHSGGKSKTSTPTALATIQSPGSVSSSFVANYCSTPRADSVYHCHHRRTTEVGFLHQTDVQRPNVILGSTCVSLSVEGIKEYCSEGNYFLMENQLEKIQFKYAKGSMGKEEASTVVRNLMSAYYSLEECTSLASLLLKWIPLLSQLHGIPSLWETIFSLPKNILPLEIPCMSISLVVRCSNLWTPSHILSCQLWILSTMQSSSSMKSKLSLPLMLRFLVTTLGQQSVQSISFSENITQRKSECLATHDNATSAIQLALDCAELLHGKNTNSESTKRPTADVMSLALECVKIYHNESADSVDCAVSGSSFSSAANVSLIKSRNAQDNRNILSDWLVLILQVGKCGKKHLDLVTKVLLSLLPSSGWEGQIVPVVLLRLYAYFPSLMALNDSKLRGILLDAAGENAPKWLKWRSPLDSQLSEMIENLSINPHQRLLQSMSDFSKRHPLVVARYFSELVHILDSDAAVCSDRRGQVNEKSNNEVALAKTKAGLVKISVRHWGYSFSEIVWASVLEILVALPGEVTFSCGRKMGLMDLLAIYLKLIFTQRQINRNDNTSRIREKVSKLLYAFRASHRQSWDEWVESKLAGIETWGKVKSILLECQLISESDGQKAP